MVGDRRIPVNYPVLIEDGMIPNGSRVLVSLDDLVVDFEAEIKLAAIAGPLARHRPLPKSFDDLGAEVEAVLGSAERACREGPPTGPREV